MVHGVFADGAESNVNVKGSSRHSLITYSEYIAELFSSFLGVIDGREREI